MKFEGENPGIRCSSVKFRIKLLEYSPRPLNLILSNTTHESQHFLQIVKELNFKIISFAANIMREFNFAHSLQGEMQHWFGSPRPLTNEDPQLLELYFVGTFEEEAARRNCFSPDTR